MAFALTIPKWYNTWVLQIFFVNIWTKIFFKIFFFNFLKKYFQKIFAIGVFGGGGIIEIVDKGTISVRKGAKSG